MIGSGLMDSTCTYSELIQKYQNFLTPVCNIFVGGKNISKDCNMIPESVSITLSLTEASSVSMQIVNVYDREKSQISSKAKNIFKLGNDVSVEIGYGSSLQKVFVGYIYEVGVEFSDVPSLSITAMDVRRLMMDYEVSNYTHTASSYSEAFESVMSKYSKLCSTKVDSTETIKEAGKPIDGIVQQGTDFNFVTQVLCKREEREFMVFGDTAYYRKSDASKPPIVTLEWGNGLISFHKNTLYKNRAIEVLGYDMNKAPVVSSATATSDKKAVKPVAQQQKRLIIVPDAVDKAKADKRAKKEAEKERKKSQQGSGNCIGLPELIPGRFIKVSKMDTDIDGTYYIKQVQHQFGSDGFTTSFDIGGYK